jgi:hypothetical protein
MGRQATKIELLVRGVDVAVSGALEVGLFGEDVIEEVVVEFVVQIDEDWEH